MRRSNKLLALVAVLVAACLATFAVLRYEEHKENIKTSGETVLAVPADTVERLSWTNEDGSLSFHKSEGRWRYDGDEAFPVDDDIIASYLSRFEALSAAFIIEDVEDYAQYGLDKPVCTIAFSTADQSYEVKLGDYSQMDAQRYVSTGDGSVYLVADDPLDDFDAQLKDVIDHDETPSYDEVVTLAFSGAEDYEVVYREEGGGSYREDDVYFTQDGKALDPDRVEGYLDDIAYLSLTDYVTYNATAEELADCGLDEPELTVTLTYTAEDGDEAETFVLHVSRNPEERKAAQEEDGDEEEITAYARVGNSQIVYQISSYNYRHLMACGYDDLRHKEVLPAELDDVAAVDISLEGNSYTLTAEGKKGERVWSYGEEELEGDDFPDALKALSAERFTGDPPAGKREIGLTVHLDLDGEPTVQIDLYRCDGTYCLAVVDGQSVSLVERSRVVALIEAVNAIVLN